MLSVEIEEIVIFGSLLLGLKESPNYYGSKTSEETLKKSMRKYKKSENWHLLEMPVFRFVYIFSL